MTPVTNRALTALFKLRVAVARFGEMDAAGWWNTRGVLGPRGETVYRRGLPKTHFFAQARVVLAVAEQRSTEVYPHRRGQLTLWALPAVWEEALRQAMREWLDRASDWHPFFRAVQPCDGTDLLGWLKTLDLVDDHVADEVRTLRRSAEGRAVLVPGSWPDTNPPVLLLAAAFSRAEPRKLAVPYARIAV